ncbi:MAG: hypothetical protein J7K89_07175 [Candidatus Cloacimonetes bacterium]|nr:hypothetical protein [Candidatus Cloacimonadota bacterium]
MKKIVRILAITGAVLTLIINIFQYDGDRVEIGMQVTVADDKIEAINRSHRITKWIGKFPLGSALRSPLLKNMLWNIYKLEKQVLREMFSDGVDDINIGIILLMK